MTLIIYIIKLNVYVCDSDCPEMNHQKYSCHILTKIIMKVTENNPFKTFLVIETSEIRPKKQYNISTIVVEKTKPLSLWIDDALLQATKNMSTSAKDMVFYILRYLGENRETIEITFENYCARMGEMSLRTFQRAIFELDDVLIAKKKTRKNVYYINPYYFFKGSRVKAYPDYINIGYIDPVILKLRELSIIPERELEKSNIKTD